MTGRGTIDRAADWVHRLRLFDTRFARALDRFGAPAHRVSLGVLFLWFGLLKLLGHPTTTSLVAHTVYWGDPQVMVAVLGWWEMAIGFTLMVRPAVRIALVLLAVRLPGILLAFVLEPEVLFVRFPFAPTPEGQYLLKDLGLFFAALAIGGTVRAGRRRRRARGLRPPPAPLSYAGLAMNDTERQLRLENLAAERDPSRRRLVALGVVADALREIDLEPVLVGGAALEFYTAGGYTTADVDLALPVGPDVDAVFAKLGFTKEGRYWVRAELDLLFEAPAPAGLPGETAPRTVVEIDGLRVVVLGVEDLLVDRLRGAVHRRSDEDRRWARRLALLYADRLDWDYLREVTAPAAEEAAALAELAQEARE